MYMYSMYSVQYISLGSSQGVFCMLSLAAVQGRESWLTLGPMTSDRIDLPKGNSAVASRQLQLDEQLQLLSS